jgi:NAD(P)-dependent dehydrogenase (short-subunit alcohol dehydrogenase family)
VTADVTDVHELGGDRRTRGRLGPVDLLVNNAGIAGPIGPINDSDDCGEPSTSTCGVVNATRHVPPA